MPKIVVILPLLIISCGSLERADYEGKQVSDGCSGGTPWAKQMFEDACYNHDVCYRVGDSREGCDRQFLKDMERICNHMWPCTVEARVMYAAVRMNPRGDELFKRRHRKESK